MPYYFLKMYSKSISLLFSKIKVHFKIFSYIHLSEKYQYRLTTLNKMFPSLCTRISKGQNRYHSHFTSDPQSFWHQGPVLLLFSCPVMSDSLRPHALQHTRRLCPSPSPRVYSSSCPLHQ